MKHFISYDIWVLSMEGETLKLKHFLKDLNPQANVVCLQKHKLNMKEFWILDSSFG
jgi:hypothetical protein